MADLAPTYTHPGADRYLRPGGPWDVPTLDRLLDEAPDSPTLVVDDRVALSSQEVRDRVAHLAGGLRELGSRPGDVVAWQLANRHEAVLLYRACWRLGCVAAPLHHRMGPGEITPVLERLQPRIVLDDPETLPEGPPVTEPAADPAALAVVLLTAGSTGGPKAVLHTHRSLACKARAMVEVHGLGTGDTVLMPAPLAHVSGLLNGLLVPGLPPMTTVLMERWDPDRALELIARHDVSFMVGPPTFFLGLLHADSFDPDRVRSLRLISSGGAGVTTAFAQEAAAGLGCVVKRSYGSTEAPTVATTPVAFHDSALAWETDGRAVGEAELRVVDPETFDDRPPGEPGELWLRGPELFSGYLDPTDTAAVTREGWLRTGDLATVDDGGWLRIVGRLKDVIIRGGENISAGEVEALLESHPAVRQAVAVGEPDERLGERVAAFVVASEPFDLETCRAWFAEQGAARFKTPERVVAVEEVPLLAAGKPDRAALRRRLTSE